jgi:transcriptional regulator with XRE-family HTH domain
MPTRFATARSESGMTGKQLAQAAGVSETAISAYVLGIRRPKPATAQRLAEVLDRTVLDLFGDILPTNTTRQQPTCLRQHCDRPSSRSETLCDYHRDQRTNWPLPPIPATGDPAWRQHAACAGLDLELFFPEPVPGANIGITDDVYEACRACPVRGDCLNEAIANGDEGVWGGTNYLHRARSPQYRRIREVA